MLRLLRWLWRGDEALAHTADETNLQSSAPSVVLALLAAWTTFSSCALLFFEGGVTRVLAGGLADHAGQRLLGAQWLGLAAFYAVAALRRQRGLGWIAVATQLATGLAAGYTLVTGDGDAGTAFLCAVSLLFALVLVAFLLATQPRYAAPPPTQPDSRAWGDAPTEWLVPPASPAAGGNGGAPGQSGIAPGTPRDDDLLGM